MTLLFLEQSYHNALKKPTPFHVVARFYYSMLVLICVLAIVVHVCPRVSLSVDETWWPGHCAHHFRDTGVGTLPLRGTARTRVLVSGPCPPTRRLDFLGRPRHLRVPGAVLAQAGFRGLSPDVLGAFTRRCRFWGFHPNYVPLKFFAKPSR